MKNKGAIPAVLGMAGLISWGLYALLTRYPMMPDQASEQAVHVDAAWNGLLIVEGVIYALVMAFIFYCLWAFRAVRREEQGDKMDHSRGYTVEAVWILASVALTLGLAALGAQELRALINDPSADINIEVHAQQFSWEFYYPDLKAYGSQLTLERGKRHRLIFTSKDVVHAFWVPEFRIKQDIVPGKVISMIITPTKVGQYILQCNKLCGSGHTDMLSSVKVVEHEDFEKEMKGEF